MLFGNKIKELGDEQGVLQRQLAALLEIDTPMFSKIERGDRRAKCEQVNLQNTSIKMTMRCCPYGWQTRFLMLLMERMSYAVMPSLLLISESRQKNKNSYSFLKMQLPLARMKNYV